MKKVAVILSGCGVYDGSEIHETVLTLLALDHQGAHVSCFAPSIPQAHVINHLTGEVDVSSPRNVLEESARITRGNIKELSELKATGFDAMIIPGGFGAAKNLCTFAFDAEDCKILPQVEQVIRDFHNLQKPVGLLCIAPVMGAKLLNGNVTIGSDEGTAAAIVKMGGSHTACKVQEVHVDEINNLITTPAYMLDARISELAVGIENLVRTVLNRA